MTQIMIDRALVEQVLETIEGLTRDRLFTAEWARVHGATIAALRTALAHQAEPVQEPVAWYQKRGQEVLTSHPACWGREDEPWTPLYTAPPQRLPLTEEEIYDMYNEPRSDAEMVAFARAVEAAHGIKERV